MVSVKAVRTVALLICVAGIAGMIVASILDHNGAAVTFGLVSAVAVVCAMVAKAVAADTIHRLAQPDSPGGADVSGTGRGPGRVAPPSDALAEVVEAQVQGLVAAGGQEADVRRLVGEAVRLGRSLEGAGAEPARPIGKDPH